MWNVFRRLLGGRPRAVRDAASEARVESVDRADTAARIEILAWGGFETPASTLEAILEEYLRPEAVGADDRRWIEAEVARAFAAKRDAEATWPAQTDVDRLAAAFAALEAAGIIALHRAGNTRSDGISDAAEVYHARRDQGGDARGFVFYHGQDVEAALAGYGLYLAFGSFDGRDETAAGIAAEIVAAVEAQGLRTDWDGDVDRRILVHPIRWLNRTPSDP